MRNSPALPTSWLLNLACRHQGRLPSVFTLLQACPQREGGGSKEHPTPSLLRREALASLHVLLPSLGRELSVEVQPLPKRGPTRELTLTSLGRNPWLWEQFEPHSLVKGGVTLLLPAEGRNVGVVSRGQQDPPTPPADP